MFMMMMVMMMFMMKFSYVYDDICDVYDDALDDLGCLVMLKKHDDTNVHLLILSKIQWWQQYLFGNDFDDLYGP